MTQPIHTAKTSAWREPIVWLLASGPLAAVIAGIATMVLAYQGADQVVSAGVSPPSVQRAAQDAEAAAQPAQWARNHSATLNQRR
jgi:uncharacterized protein